MSESQGPGGGALEPHHNMERYGGGYGHPPSSGKDPYSPPSTTTTGNNAHGLTDISGDAQLSLLKNSSGLNTFTTFSDPDGLGTRISDGFMEMRYIELGNWDLGGYGGEGLTARLIDSRSLSDSPDNVIQYRPWEKPDSSSPNTLSSITTTSSSPSNGNGQGQGQLILTTNGNVITTSASQVSRGGKSPPPTLTTLTNAFPTFSDAFGPNGQKLPSFQSQFNSFNEATLIHPAQHHHLGNNVDILTTQGATTLPSFHTLPANRGYIHHGGHHPGLLSATQIQARDLPNIQQQFLDERHIQLFPLGATTMTAVPVTSGHHGGIPISNGNGHHFVTTTNGMNGGQSHFVSGTNHGQPSQHLIEFVPISQMQLHAATAGPHGHYPPPPAHPHAKLQPQTTDGTIPGLNLNDLHHTHSNLNLNLNVPPSSASSVIGKYISSDGTLETLIAVKTPPPGSITFDPHQQHAQNNMGHHHQIIKLEQPPQNSPQIVSNSTNGNGTPNGGQQNGTNGINGKRQQKRKRNGVDPTAADSFSQQQQHLHNNNHHHNNHHVNSTTNNGNGHDLNSDPQVSSVSSSDSDFKRPNLGLNGGLDMNGGGSDPGGLDKPAKKKRKRCGECVGCQRKDNCGDCAPCRNDKSHQICKMRRCEKLTEKKPNARGEKMDGRGRQSSSNSGVPSAASVMPSYYGGSQPHTPSGDSASSFSPRDRFWSQGGGNGGGGPSPPDPWATGSSSVYTPQLLPPGQQQDGNSGMPQPNFTSPASHNSSPPNSGSFNIPSHSPYPPVNGNGGLNVNVNGDMSGGGFSGPSPPNPIQPIPLSSPYGPPPNSSSPRSRQYTPSTTPSPHVVNNSQQHPQQSPLGGLGSGLNGMNGNGINGNSSHSSNESSPPNSGNNGNFDNYLNRGSNMDNSSRSPSRSNSTGGNPPGQTKNLTNEPTGHPNELPGYLPPPRQSLHNSSSRYRTGELKASTGDMMQHYHQQQQQQQHHHHEQQQQQNEPYYQNYGQYQQPNMSYYDSFQQPQQQQQSNRRPFDPYQPYPNPNQQQQQSSFNENYNSVSDPQYNILSRPNESLPSNMGNKSPGGSRKHRHGHGHAGGGSVVENGTKIDSCESLQHQQGGGKPGIEQQIRSGGNSFEDDANFEAVLHGHMNHFNNLDDHTSPSMLNNGEQNNTNFSYDSIRQHPYEQPLHRSSIESNSNTSQSNPSRTSPGKLSGESPTGAKKKEKKRSRSSVSDEEASTKYKFNSEKSFLALGHPQSPPNNNMNSNSSSNQSSSSDAGKALTKLEPIDHNHQQQHSIPYSEGGNTTGSPNSASNPSFEQNPQPPPAPPKPRKKKPWKKAKQINSEQLLEERERNCAEYCTATENSASHALEKSRSTDSWKDTKVKEEPGTYSKMQEKNITIDHQKEEQLKKELEERGMSRRESMSGAGTDDDNDSSTSGVKQEKKNVPLVECGCFPIDEVHPEPGPFYTHLGAAHNLVELRETLEMRTGFRGQQVRFEKVIYTGKEGKTSQGCPLAKWIIRRGSYEEQLLFLVKHRKGHKCATAWIVVCCVIWEGVPPHFADNLYDTIVYKLNRFGIPTTRRSDTNEQRSCACQGVDPDTCGAAYSFGCAWSMFFNGCKYARSRNVRKFRLTEEHEEGELEEKVQHLATHLAPLYERVASESYKNQVEHENEGLECRLGYRPGRPFSGVTACLDYCSHAHKDAHNMINGCTVTVAFTRNRNLGKGDDEQYHVLPLYKLDESDEHGSKEGQKQKVKKGQLEILKKYPSKVRIRKVPLLPSRRRGKTKPPSGGSSSSSHGHHSGSSKGSDMYSSELSSLSMPPPIKREKTSIFDELSGPMGGSDLFDHASRFHHPGPPPFSNLLLSKSHSHSKLGMGMSMSLEDHPTQICQISSTVLDSDNAGRSSSLWTPSPYGGVPQGGHHGVGGGFRSYFEPPMPGAHQYPPVSAPPQFGHNFDLNMNLSSPRGGGLAGGAMGAVGGNSSGTNTNSNSNTSNSLMSPNPNNPNNNTSSVPPSNSANNSSSTATTPVPGYTSMSPSSILPSFRHTFMTEAETLSLSSPSTGATGSPIADSTSSPRSGKPPSQQHQQPSLSTAPTNPATSPASATATSAFSHQDALGGLGPPPSSYFNPTPVVPTYSSAAGNSSLYHPHPHHPTPSSCLSSSAGSGGVPFNSPGSYGSPGSSFVPPDHHHAFGMGMNMNPVMSPWNAGNMNMNPSGYSHSAYGPGPSAMNPSAPPSYHHNQMSSLNMNMNPMGSSFPHMNMNQYNPYGGQSNFMSAPSMQHAAVAAAAASMQHSHHQWANPLPSFISNPHAHAHPPPPPPSCFVAPPKPKVIPEVNESFSDNEDAFKDGHLGGVGIALTHGSVILQCAKHEMHATTSLRAPNRMYPSRICLVFYQHKSMNNRFHGWSEWEKKIEAKKLQEVKLINQGKLEASPRKMKQLIKEGYLADNP